MLFAFFRRKKKGICFPGCAAAGVFGGLLTGRTAFSVSIKHENFVFALSLRSPLRIFAPRKQTNKYHKQNQR
jgi:hypothetical protein